jgi:hypothetical protein
MDCLIRPLVTVLPSAAKVEDGTELNADAAPATSAVARTSRRLNCVSADEISADDEFDMAQNS